MKINPVAIQSYQQLTRREPQQPTVGQEQAEAVARDVTITPQTAKTSSGLAVKAPEGSYAEYLTDAERGALDLLFQRFADTERFGSGYSREAAETAPNRTLGKVIDLKV